jgi:hypothetical protein
VWRVMACVLSSPQPGHAAVTRNSSCSCDRNSRWDSRVVYLRRFRRPGGADSVAAAMFSTSARKSSPASSRSGLNRPLRSWLMRTLRAASITSMGFWIFQSMPSTLRSRAPA